MASIRRNKTGNDDIGSIQIEEKRTASLLNVIVVLAIAAVAYTDWIVVANISLGYLYVLPIALSALVNTLPLTVALAAFCTFLQDIFGPTSDDLHVRVIRGAISLTGFLSVGFFVTLVAKQRARLALEVRRQRDEYQHDLILAAQVQRQVLPKPPTVAGLELAATMQTARLLGGDYYDFFPISDDIVDVVIADVSGKGAAASLLMPSLAVALRLRARELNGPAAIIKDLDTVLKQITNPATFVTIFYARFNPTGRTLEYASGGHNPPLLVRTKTGETLLLEDAGPIVGILPDAQFSNTVVPLQQGDILTFFTDGVTEQENDAGEEFSLDRLKEVVLGSSSESASTLVDRVTEAVSVFSETTNQADDLTLVIARIL